MDEGLEEGLSVASQKLRESDAAFLPNTAEAPWPQAVQCDVEFMSLREASPAQDAPELIVDGPAPRNLRRAGRTASW
jgi:hypothetical protein